MQHSEHMNRCIGCTVQQCAHHAGKDNFCTLDKVSIGTHEKDPTEPQCVDCESFRLGN